MKYLDGRSNQQLPHKITLSKLLGTPNEYPFFLVGAQRSGTTMLRLMMNAHPRLAVPFETKFIPDFYHRLSDFGDLSIPENQSRLLNEIATESFVVKGQLIIDRQAILAHKPQDYAQLINAIFEEYAASKGKYRWGDKTPSYVTDIDILWKLFPGCKIVHIVRDGRDVASSLRRLEWGSKNLPNLARTWANQVTLGRKMGNIIGEHHYLEIKYEDLVSKPTQALQSVCTFIGERFDKRMLNYHVDSVQSMPKASLNYHKKSVCAPDRGKIGMWRSMMSVADQIVFEQNSERALEQFGYATNGMRTSFSSKIANLKYALINRW